LRRALRLTTDMRRRRLSMKRDGLVVCHRPWMRRLVAKKILARAWRGDADVGEAALFLEAGAAVVVERALMRNSPSSQPGRTPSRTPALGAVQRHDRHAPRAGGLVRFHHQRHMFQKSGEIGKLLHRAHEFLEVFEPPAASGVLSCATSRYSRLVEHELREFVLRLGVDQGAPALEIAEQRAQRRARLRLDLLALDEDSRALHERNVFARANSCSICSVASPSRALAYDDALEGEIVGGLRDAAQIGERVADFGALIEARTPMTR